MKKLLNLKFIVLSVFILLSFVLKVSAQTDDKVIGQYWSPEKNGKIEIYKVANKYFGKFVWGSNPRKDTKNPKKELRTRDVVGMVFLTNFLFKDNEYVDGQIYDPESGKTYSCKMWLDNGNLKVRGFVGFSFLGRTETFSKVQ
ncbi:DUF2147 domain-containing protein [Haliscomenobacter sp.]|uniref:DUF2147 domain-containing protein n=1 Tax=Haliscomenobacter sp. TaxID=2717303 RepID=UPI003364FEE5